MPKARPVIREVMHPKRKRRVRRVCPTREKMLAAKYKRRPWDNPLRSRYSPLDVYPS